MFATPEEAKAPPFPANRSRTGSRLSLLSTVSSVRVKLSSVYRLSTSSSIPASPILEHSAEGDGAEKVDQQLLKPPDLTQVASSRESSPPPTPSVSLSMTLDGFATYLLSTDNSPFAEQDTGISHDMTRPLSEYYISSSHNTYLVGHQLVGDSTIEGYIRTLLHSCRSVESE
jgi:phosphatidylinositol phospholipase C delta